MDKLRHLLHELIDHAVPQGNKRGELHALADELAEEPVPAAEPVPVKAPAPVKATPPSLVPFKSPADPGGPATA